MPPSAEHHAYGAFCYPLDADTLCISIKTGKDVDRVVLFWNDPYKPELAQTELERKALLYASVWSACVRPPFKRCHYCFVLYRGAECWLCFENGFTPYSQSAIYDGRYEFFKFPWMNSADIIAPPEWAKAAVWYQIFPSRFSKSKHNNVPNLHEWAGPDTPVTNSEKYGGDMDGITERLDYLADVGITGVYLNPINTSVSQHKYDTADYLTIDSDFGDSASVRRFVAEAHKRSMPVMLDGVFNHSGWQFFAWQDVVQNRQKSKYADWFMVNDWHFISKPCDNAANGRYYTFSFTDKMPKLNTNNSEVRAYLIDVVKQWIREYDIDALRLDVANEVSHRFLKELRLAVKSLKPDFFIVGEIWTDSTPWLRGDECDSVIHYPLRTVITDFVRSKERTAGWLEQELNRCQLMYEAQTVSVLLTQLDSHDTPRFVHTVGDRELARLSFALLFSLPGSACLYYGTEVLLNGGPDPDCRRCMPWKEIAEGRYNDELDFFRTLISLRKGHEAMRCAVGSFLYDDCCGAGERTVRFTKECSGETLLFVFHFSEEPVRLPVPDGMAIRSVLLSRSFVIETEETGKAVMDISRYGLAVMQVQ